MKKIRYFIPAIIWMIFIVIMSHTNGNDSSNQSNFIAQIILKFINVDLNILTFIIRKIAHMCEYAILFLLIYYGLHKTIKYQYKLLISLIISILYLYNTTLSRNYQTFTENFLNYLLDITIKSFII